MSDQRLDVCHLPACLKPVKAGMLMCLPHWRMVPEKLKREVLLSWKARLAVTRTTGRPVLATVDEIRGAFARHEKAKADAIAAVNEKAIKRALAGDAQGDVLDFR